MQSWSDRTGMQVNHLEIFSDGPVQVRNSQRASGVTLLQPEIVCRLHSCTGFIHAAQIGSTQNRPAFIITAYGRTALPRQD